jgi:ABC-type proline/glycine betaine transport system ATPase subunit
MQAKAAIKEEAKKPVIVVSTDDDSSDDEATKLKKHEVKLARLNSNQSDTAVQTMEPATATKKHHKHNTKTLASMIALKNIDLRVKKGEFIIVIGKIGSGKSSLLHALLNEMTFVPDSEIELHGGKDAYLAEDEVREIRQKVYSCASFESAPIKLQGKVAYVEQ